TCSEAKEGDDVGINDNPKVFSIYQYLLCFLIALVSNNLVSKWQQSTDMVVFDRYNIRIKAVLISIAS
ncbi:MAG: hypothetical protein ACTH88_07285, partial [Psychrobacter celer]